MDRSYLGPVGSPYPSQSLEPAKFGGKGKAANLPQGGLLGRTFPTRCPPAVSLNSIIIAVCGIHDLSNNSSPSADGWFHTDFYLFHHLLKNTANEQHWLTCVDPRTMVQKYTQLEQGNPHGGRRVVLDASMLPQVQDVSVLPPKDLMSTFLEYVSAAARSAREDGRQILLLVFSHGMPDPFRFMIGLRNERPVWCDRSQVRGALLSSNPNPRVSCMTTSCYGGGWALADSPTQTTMAAVNEDEESDSWPLSQATSQQFCVSPFASAVTESLIRSEETQLGMVNSESIDERTPAYVGLQKVVHDLLEKFMPPPYPNTMPFSAEDDLFGQEWRQRSGFPLAGYKARFEMLRSVAPVPVSIVTAHGSVRMSPTLEVTIPEGIQRVRSMATVYFNSFPGRDEISGNQQCHTYCRRVLKGESMTADALEHLACMLQYRLEDVIGRATKYKEYLGLSFSSCSDIDIEAFKYQINADQTFKERYSQTLHMVSAASLFDETIIRQGVPYQKGKVYITLALLESGWPKQKVEDAIQSLKILKKSLSKIDRTIRGLGLNRDRTVRIGLDEYMKTRKRKHGDRASSPTKHPRKSLEGLFPSRKG